MAAGKTAILAVRILGDAKGARSAFGEGERHAGRFQRALSATGKGVLAVGAMAGAAAVAGGKALFDMGQDWAQVTNTIRAGTGATGDALQGLIGDAKAIGRDVPHEYEKVGSTVADLNTRLGLSGDTMRTVASQYLEAGRILGEDVDINTTAAAFKAFGLEGEQVSSAMDSLFRASQATGVGMNELAGGVQKAAPALVNLGFTFEDSIALMGSLDKAGLNSQQVASSLTRSLTSLAKEGEQPADAFRRIVGELDGYVKKGDTAAALQLSNKIFGTRGSSQFVHAIQSGVLELDNLTKAAGVSEDTIIGVAKETMTASEHWQVLKNNAFAALEPLGSAVFSTVSDALGVIAANVKDVDFSFISNSATDLKNVIKPIFDAIVPTIARLAPKVIELASAFNPLKFVLDALAPILPKLLTSVAGLAETVLAVVLPVVQNLIGQLMPVLQSLAEAIMPAVIQVLEAVVPALVTVVEAVLPFISVIVDALMPVLETLAAVVADVFGRVAGLIQSAMTLVRGIILTVTSLIRGDWAGVWDGVKGIVSGAWNLITGIISGALAVVRGVISTGLAFIKGIWNTAWSAVTGFLSNTWNSIKNGVSSGVSAVTSKVTGLADGIKRALNIASALYDIGKNIISSMVSGIGSMGSALYNKAKSMASNAVSGIKNFLGIRSPSRVFRDLGRATGDGLILGLNDRAGAVNAAFDSLTIPPAPSIRVDGPRGAAAAAAAPVHIEVNGALDPVGVARQIEELLRRYSQIRTVRA